MYNKMSAINRVIKEGRRDDKSIESLRKYTFDEEPMGMGFYNWGSAARAALTVIGEEDYSGYDEGTDYFIIGLTNIMQENEKN